LTSYFQQEQGANYIQFQISHNCLAVYGGSDSDLFFVPRLPAKGSDISPPSVLSRNTERHVHFNLSQRIEFFLTKMAGGGDQLAQLKKGN
jgi:hypothetical protein